MWRKNVWMKLQMNEHEIYFHVSDNSWLQTVPPWIYKTWKYKVKLSAEAANGGAL